MTSLSILPPLRVSPVLLVRGLLSWRGVRARCCAGGGGAEALVFWLLRNFLALAAPLAAAARSPAGGMQEAGPPSVAALASTAASGGTATPLLLPSSAKKLATTAAGIIPSSTSSSSTPSSPVVTKSGSFPFSAAYPRRGSSDGGSSSRKGRVMAEATSAFVLDMGESSFKPLDTPVTPPPAAAADAIIAAAAADSTVATTAPTTPPRAQKGPPAVVRSPRLAKSSSAGVRAGSQPEATIASALPPRLMKKDAGSSMENMEEGHDDPDDAIAERQQEDQNEAKEVSRLRGRLTPKQKLLTHLGAFFLGSIMSWTGALPKPLRHRHRPILFPLPAACARRHFGRLSAFQTAIDQMLLPAEAPGGGGAISHTQPLCSSPSPSSAALWAGLVNYLIYLPFRKLFPSWMRTRRFILGVAHRPTMVRRGGARGGGGGREEIGNRCTNLAQPSRSNNDETASFNSSLLLLKCHLIRRSQCSHCTSMLSNRTWESILRRALAAVACCRLLLRPAAPHSRRGNCRSLSLAPCPAGSGARSFSSKRDARRVPPPTTVILTCLLLCEKRLIHPSLLHSGPAPYTPPRIVV